MSRVTCRLCAGGVVRVVIATANAFPPQLNLLRRKVLKTGDLKRRYFVLDHHDLRYYTDASQSTYLGHIDLGTVTEIRKSVRDDVPDFALDLVWLSPFPRSLVLCPLPRRLAGASFDQPVCMCCRSDPRAGLVVASFVVLH